MYKKFLYLTGFLLILTSHAELISLKDGSLFHGEITKTTENHITLKTRHAGIISIEREAIIPSSKSKKIRPTQKPSKWSSRHYVKFNGRRGNHINDSSSLGSQISYKDALWTTKLYARYSHRSQYYRNSRIHNNDDESIAGFDIDKRIGKKNSIYIRSEFEKDSREKLPLRATTASGFSYYLYDDKFNILRLRLGYFHRQETYINREASTKSGLDTGLAHQWLLFGNLKFKNDVTYTPDFDKPENKFKIDHESSLLYPLGKKKQWALQLGIRNNYNNLPFSSSQEQLDTYYFTRLSVSFL